MPLLTDTIKTVLETGGLIKFPSELTTDRNDYIETGTGDMVVQNSYGKHRLTASTADNTITMTRLANDAPSFNCVNIHTIDQVSAIGPVRLPGYVYTGDFSGCVFYLFKTHPKIVTGVHAYNGLVDQVVKRFLRKPKINRVPREFGPGDYFVRNRANQLVRYPTRGQLDVLGGEHSLSFLSCVENTSATTFLFSVKGSAEGARVKRLLETHVDNF